MTIISNSFAPACRQLLPKYTISTLRSIGIVDNQKGYGCILKFTRFSVSDCRVLDAHFYYVRSAIPWGLLCSRKDRNNLSNIHQTMTFFTRYFSLQFTLLTF